MNALDLVVDVAATWRGTEIVVEDKVTQPFRQWVDSRYPGSQANYLLSCKRCVSVWVGGAVALGILPRPVKIALALSAGVLAVGKAAELIDGRD